MSEKFTPLPYIDPERDGLKLENLSFPVGFDEERIVVNTEAVRRTARIAGLGGVTVMGAAGKTGEYSANIAGMSSDGSATLSSSLFKRRQSFVNGVKVETWAESETWAKYNDKPTPDVYRYAPVTISANTTERDEQLRDSDTYKKGLYDAEGHATFIDETIAGGLYEGASQRYNQRPHNFLSHTILAGFVIYNGTGVLNNEMYNFSGLLSGIAGFGLGSVVIAAANKRPVGDSQITFMFGLDRKFAAQSLAKMSRFAKALD